MIAALSPASVNYDETRSTLRFADRARNVVRTATVHRESAIPGASEARLRAQALEAVRAARGGGERGDATAASHDAVSIGPRLHQGPARARAPPPAAADAARDRAARARATARPGPSRAGGGGL